MPTDAELRTLFRDASAPESRIDTAAVIRRSKRRRLPQQVSAGGVLTLAVAGIGVAGISGLQSLSPRTASDTAADAPSAVSESAPFAGAESGATQPSCTTGVLRDVTVADSLTVATRFAATASPGQPVAGSLVLTNTADETVAGTVVDAMVALSRDGLETWVSDATVAGTRVQLMPGEAAILEFTFDADSCGPDDSRAPLDPGEYDVSALLRVLPDNGAVEVVGGPPSAITIR